MISDSGPKNIRRGIYVLAAFLVLLGINWTYKNIFLAPDGYLYTVAWVTGSCPALSRVGRRYNLKYIVNGDTLKIDCTKIEGPSAVQTNYLLRYAKVTPEYFDIIDYVLLDSSLVIPAEGWIDPPYEAFKKLD